MLNACSLGNFQSPSKLNFHRLKRMYNKYRLRFHHDRIKYVHTIHWMYTSQWERLSGQHDYQSRGLFCIYTLREESTHTNVILQYKLLAAILNVVCSVIQQS